MSLYGIDLNLLVALDALLIEQHVGRAAERVGLSQSAMSHTLRRLREVFGDPLLVRIGGGMQPSPRALQLRPTLRTCLEQLEHAVLQPQSFDPATSQQVFRVGCESYFSAVVLPPLMASLRNDAPGMEIVLVHLGDPTAQLHDGDVDVVLSVSSARKDLEREVVFCDDFACLLRKDHPVIRHRLTLRRYADTPHVVVRVGQHGPTAVDRVLAERGMKRSVALRVTDFLAAPHAVASSDLLFTCPRRLARMFEGTSGLRVLPLPIALPSFEYSMFWLPARNTDLAHTWFREQIGIASTSTSSKSG